MSSEMLFKMYLLTKTSVHVLKVVDWVEKKHDMKKCPL